MHLHVRPQTGSAPHEDLLSARTYPMTQELRCTCKAEHWQWHDETCPKAATQKKRGEDFKSSNHRVTEAYAHIRALVQFAYEQGFHELGYAPETVLMQEIERLRTDLSAAERLAKIMIGAAGKHAERVVELEAQRPADETPDDEGVADLSMRFENAVQLVRDMLPFVDRADPTDVARASLLKRSEWLRPAVKTSCYCRSIDPAHRSGCYAEKPCALMGYPQDTRSAPLCIKHEGICATHYPNECPVSEGERQ